MKTIANVLGVARSHLHERVHRPTAARGSYCKAADEELLPLIRRLVDERPTYGYRRVTALVNRVLAAEGLVSRVSPVQTALRNCTRDEGGPFEFGNQVLISSHRKLLSSKAMVVNVAETSGHDPGRHGRERRAQANRCRSVESGLGDVKTGG